jgi:hypothetical protein
MHFEVKSIGMQDSDFGTLLRSMGGHPAGGPVSVYQPTNQLPSLSRVRSRRQLTAANGRKNVVIVIDELTWRRFDSKIEWIDWSRPQFVEPDSDWNQFLSLHQKRYPGLPEDLAATIRWVDSIKVYVQNHAFALHPKAEHSYRT